MSRALLTALAVVLALSGCGRAAAKPASKDADASLQIRHVLDRHAGLYMEGSLWHLRVTGADDVPVIDSDPGEDLVTLRVAHGNYRVESYERPCDVNCGHLDPPTDSCSAHLAIEPGAKVEAVVTLRPGEGCKIAFAK